MKTFGFLQLSYSDIGCFVQSNERATLYRFKYRKDKDFSSYVDLCNYRLERKRVSVGVVYSYRSMYRVFRDFDENNQFPLHYKRNPLQLVKSAYLCLNPYFKSLIDNYISYATN